MSEKLLQKIEEHPFFELSDLVELPVEELSPHPEGNLFPPLSKEQMELLKESIAKDGILHNLVVADKGLLSPDSYTILSGHNRWKAARELGLSRLPCRIVRPAQQTTVSPDEIYCLFLEIFLETNLAQRIIDPVTYRKSIERREKAMVRRLKETQLVRKKLIPEFQKAFIENRLPFHLAKALADLSPDEQKQFVVLIGGQYTQAQQINLETLKKVLQEQKAQLAEASRLIETLQKRNRELENRVKELTNHKQNMEQKLKYYLEAKQTLEVQLSELKRRLKSSTPSPEMQKRMENLQIAIKRKEEEIERLKESLADAEEKIESLLGQLKREKRRAQEEVAKVQEEFKKQLEKEKTTKENVLQNFPSIGCRPFHRFKVLLDDAFVLAEEIRADSAKLNDFEKQEILKTIKEVVINFRITMGILQGKSPAEALNFKEDLEEKDLFDEFSEEI